MCCIWVAAEKVRGEAVGGVSQWHAVGLQLRKCGGEIPWVCRSGMQWGCSPESEGDWGRGSGGVS